MPAGFRDRATRWCELRRIRTSLPNTRRGRSRQGARRVDCKRIRRRARTFAGLAAARRRHRNIDRRLSEACPRRGAIATGGASRPPRRPTLVHQRRTLPRGSRNHFGAWSRGVDRRRRYADAQTASSANRVALTTRPLVSRPPLQHRQRHRGSCAGIDREANTGDPSGCVRSQIQRGPSDIPRSSFDVEKAGPSP